MFDFDEMENTGDDENILVGGDEDLEGAGSNTKPKKDADDAEDWDLEEDLEDEGNM